MTGGKAPAFRTLAWAHLRTGVERAVFAVVAGGAGHWWTAAAARAAGVGELDADHNLRRFEAAGIVEQQAGRAGRRYRYSNEMDLQADSDVDQELRDPICGIRRRRHAACRPGPRPCRAVLLDPVPHSLAAHPAGRPATVTAVAERARPCQPDLGLERLTPRSTTASSRRCETTAQPT